jgi:hypothetical protein
MESHISQMEQTSSLHTHQSHQLNSEPMLSIVTQPSQSISKKELLTVSNQLLSPGEQVSKAGAGKFQRKKILKTATAMLSEPEKLRSITISNQEFIQWQQCLSLYKDTISRQSMNYKHTGTS